MSKFQKIDFYRSKRATSYSLLPFRFTELDRDRYVLTNVAGEFLTIPKTSLAPFVRHDLEASTPLYTELLARQFLSTVTFTLAVLRAGYKSVKF